MARRRDSFDDLNKSMGKLGISNGDDKKKKINNEDDDWSMGTNIALGVGAGLALGAGIAALSYFLGGSDDQKEEETKKLPGRRHLYVADDPDDNDYYDDHVESMQGGIHSAPSSRRYGYYQCGNCRHHWESSNTFSKGGRLNEWFTQDCERCGTPSAPYRSEPIKCRYCGRKECVCDKSTRRGRHNDPRKPHHRDRCERCRLGYPCVDASQ